MVLRFTPPADPSEKGNQHICRGGMKIKAGLELRVDTAVPRCIQEPTVERRQHCSMQCGSLDERVVWGRMGTWMCMAESLPCSPETITTLLTGLKKKNRCAYVLPYSTGNSVQCYAAAYMGGKFGEESAQFSSVQSLSCVQLFTTPWTAALQASLSITNSRSLLKLMSIESVMPSNHLISCHPLLLPPSIFPSIRVFSSESVLRIRWPKYWSFSFSISPSNEYSELISFRMDWLDLLAVQGTLKSHGYVWLNPFPVHLKPK